MSPLTKSLIFDLRFKNNYIYFITNVNLLTHNPFILTLALCLFISCATDPGFSDTPEIDFISFSKDTLVQNSLNTDSLFLTISFRDGDGDIGTGAEGIMENIILTDTRTGVVFDRFKVPELPIGELNSGIEGEISMKVFTTCCIFPDGTPPCLAPPQFPTNELSFEIELVDDSGKRSNKLITQSVLLLCN